MTDTDGDGWRRKEALRQAELRLGSQTDARRGFEARSAVMIGWLVAVSSLVGASLGAAQPQRLCVGVLLIGFLLGAVVCCVVVVWPRIWRNVGYTAREILDGRYSSQGEQLEAMALGFDEGIRLNSATLVRMGRAMSAAYFLCAGALIAAGLLLIVR